MEERRGGRPYLVEAALRAELARRRTEARRVEQRVERDLSRAVHDLKAPLSAVKGYVDMMLRGIAGPMPPAANRYLERIREVVDRERQLIDDRLRPRRDRNAPSLVDLSRALGAAVKRSERALRSKRIQLALELPPRGCPIALRHPSLMELLVRRLVRHLVAAAPPGAAARLAVRDDLGRQWIELSIDAGGEGEDAGPPPRTRDLQIALAAAERLGAHPSETPGGRTLWIDLPHEA